MHNSNSLRYPIRTRYQPNVLTMDKGGLWCDKNLSLIEDHVLSKIVIEVYTPTTYKHAIECD